LYSISHDLKCKIDLKEIRVQEILVGLLNLCVLNHY